MSSNDEGQRLDWSYVRLWARPREAEFLEAVASSTDEELIRKFPQGLKATTISPGVAALAT